ncbi:hypothetical protein UY3_15285 [Chelonia mydas]|uniref:Zinc finger and SCAN domain-containing protein 29 n=1 Tax=Chelonia mydas TaxID=8469 RepID=M7BH76_CHEMY|nr:hypothetical protein UY3_15285 [Chelonia mydas]
MQGKVEKGYTRDTQQCHMKIKQLWQAYQKTREANSHFGSASQIYIELHAILSSDPTSTPKHGVVASQESECRATSSNNEEDIVNEEEEEEENGRQESRGFILPESQELFLTPEQSSWFQDSIVAECDAREGTSGEYAIPNKL